MDFLPARFCARAVRPISPPTFPTTSLTSHACSALPYIIGKTQLEIEKDNLRAKVERLENEKQMVLQNYASLDKDHKKLREHCHNITHKLQTEESIVRQLRQQVTHYKTNISCATRLPDQMADDVIKARIDDVFHSIQNFVVRYFRGCSFGKQASAQATVYRVQRI